MDKVTVNTHGMEFGYELISAVPFAYWLHENDMLEKTISTEDSKCLYYFSPDHEESVPKRHNNNHAKVMRDGIIPNVNIHKADLNWSRWCPPPYKEHYANDEFDFDVVVCNKFNVEWKRPPVNYYSTDALFEIFDSLWDYKVLYNHMTSDMGRDDTVPSLDLNEWPVVDVFRNVTTIQSLIDKAVYSYNELQMRIYANAKLFVTVQGGSVIFTSYFGGKNVVFAKEGKELDRGSYDGWFKKLGGADIVHYNNYDDILKEIELWKRSMTL